MLGRVVAVAEEAFGRKYAHQNSFILPLAVHDWQQIAARTSSLKRYWP
jgi:hypothetical protein